MSYLILGLILFLGAHSVRIFAEGWRTQTLQRLGEGGWKGLYSVVSLLGFGLILWGYGLARQQPVLLWSPPAGMRHLAALLMLASFVLLGHAVFVTARERRDVFVITNMRVFRASGVFNVKIATMPITRILDITVDKPVLGRLLGYGHFVFESAAQAQGLRDIRFIGDPDGRDLTIQRVVQRAGLRGPRGGVPPHHLL